MYPSGNTVKTFYLQKSVHKTLLLSQYIVHTRPEKSTVSIITHEKVFCCLFLSYLFAKSGIFLAPP